MGIKCLNRYFMQNCKHSIRKMHLSALSGKKIVVDTSIYLYKYQHQKNLHENIYLMISLFHKYNIVPLFVFDGKPPPEKMDALKERKLMKDSAEMKYNELSDSLDQIQDKELIDTILSEMDLLKRQFVKISDKDVKSVKKIMDAYGVQYYDAQGESDKVCGYLTKEKFDGCMSDDMDMFVYGCPIVLRHLSLFNETILVYKFHDILKELNFTFPLFKQIAILSGTDYNIYDNNVSLFETLKWYKEFNKHSGDNRDNEFDFYDWLNENSKYIKNKESLMKTHALYDISEINPDLDNLNVQLNRSYNKDELQILMKEYGFLFV